MPIAGHYCRMPLTALLRSAKERLAMNSVNCDGNR
jgi:hypothetical protein